MFDTTTEGILELLAQGESQTIEFKERIPHQSVVAKIFSAFANTDGGILIIGVRDNGDIDGLTDEDFCAAEDVLKGVSASLFSWPIEIGSACIKGLSIVYAIVDRAPKYFYPIMTPRGEIYQRSSTQLVSIQEPKSSAFESRISTDTERNKSSIQLFIAMSFREEEEPGLVDYFKAIQRAISSTGHPIMLSRVDLTEGDYEISQKIMDEIDKADIVLTDFTLSARNVYFELGYARGKKRRIIQTARKGTDLEFDIRNWRTLFYRNATELEEKLIPELNAAFNEVKKDS